MIPDTDKAYIAGLFDGEGSIHMRRGIEKKKRHRGKPGYRLSNSLRFSFGSNPLTLIFLIIAKSILFKFLLFNVPINKNKKKYNKIFLFFCFSIF